MLRTCIFAAVLASAATAQITSPKGFLTTEGSSSHNYMLFAKVEMHWQSIDSTHVGGGTKVMTEASWRRDGSASANTSWIARTFTNWEMSLGDAAATLQVTDLSKNFKGTPTQVVAPKTLMVPDITAQPPATPAPWTTVVKFDKPFVYTAQDPFVWEVKYSANTAATNGSTDYSFDFQSTGSGANSNSGTTIGTSCTSTGETVAIDAFTTFYNHGNKFRIYRSLYDMPANVPGVMWIGSKNLDLTIPGLCTKLHTFGDVLQLQLPAADAGGRIPGGGTNDIDNIPHVPGLSGVKLYFQYWGVDVGKSPWPISLSYAKEITIPADPVPGTVTRFYHYKNTPTGSTITSGPWTGGIVTRFQ